MISNIVRIQLVDGDQLGYLDVKAGTNFPISKSIGDIRDLSSRSGSFSKTITLPGSKNNNLMLNNYFDLKVESGKFDINKIQKCTVIQNGIIIFDNVYLRLLRVINKENRGEEMYDEIEYEVQIRDSVSDFFKDTNNKYLNELSGWGVFSHEYNVSNILSSFTHTVDNGYKYTMPYIQDSNAYSIQEFLPGIYAKQYFDRIHKQNGYSYEWPSLTADTIQFDTLLIPYGGDLKKLSQTFIDGRRIEADKLAFQQRVSIFQDLFGNPSTNAKPLQIDENEVDPESLYSAATSTYLNDVIVNPPSSIQYKVTLDWSLELYNFNNVDVINGDPALTMDTGIPYLDVTDGVRPSLTIRDQVGTVRGNVSLVPNAYEEFGTYFTGMTGVPVARYEDGLVLFNGKFFVPAFGTRDICSGTNQTYIINVNNIGPSSQMKLHEQLTLDDLTGLIRFYNPSTLLTKGINYRLDIQNVRIEIAPSTDSGILPGSEINLQDFIPLKFKQSEFLSSIYQKYNLYAEIDPDNPRKILYKTRDEFYDGGEIKDFTAKLCKEIQQETYFIPEISSKKLVLSYADDDNDPVLFAYKNETNETYAQVEATFDNENVKGIKRNDEKFSPTVNAETSFGAILPVLSPDFKFNTRILVDGGVYNCSPFTIKESIDSTYTSSVYPSLNMHNKPVDPTFSIEYAQPDYYAYNPGNLTNNNLYVNHWRRTLSQINSGKMLKAYFWLTEEDFYKLKLNDILKVKESFFYINAIVDYNANSKMPTLIELLTVEDDLRLMPVGRNVKQTQIGSATSIPDVPFRPTSGGGLGSQQDALSRIERVRNNVTSTVGTNASTLGNLGVRNNLPNNFRGYVVGDDLSPTENGFYVGDSVFSSTKVSLGNDKSILTNGALINKDGNGQTVYKPDGIRYNPFYVGDGYVEPGYIDNPISDIIYTYDEELSGNTMTVTSSKINFVADIIEFSTGQTLQASGSTVDLNGTTLQVSGSTIDFNSSTVDMADALISLSPTSSFDGDIKLSTGSGIAYGTGSTKVEREYEIINWDMSAATTKNVNHLLSATEWLTIRQLDVIIKNDAGTQLYSLIAGYDGSTINGTINGINSTFISLGASSGSFFDSAAFSATGVRGWITISYTPD